MPAEFPEEIAARSAASCRRATAVAGLRIEVDVDVDVVIDGVNVDGCLGR